MSNTSYGQDSLQGIFESGTPQRGSKPTGSGESDIEAEIRSIFEREEDILKKRTLALEVEKVAFDEQVRRFESRNAR